MRLLLFEIDDILLSTHGASLAATVRALEHVYGVPVNQARYNADGKTDLQVARELLRRSGLGPEVVSAGLNRWIEAVPGVLRELLPGYPIAACPGAHSLLSALELEDDVVLGLLTGSLESTAPIKLAAAEIDGNAFRVGAFGSDESDRKQLLPTAVMRAEQILDRLLLSEEVVVVGATPADVACAHAYGARAVSVATGRFSAADLRRAGSVQVFDDLADTDVVMRALLA